MPYSTKQMLRDANGDLIPQYWDVVEQEFKPLTGRNGANDVRLAGSKIVYEFGFSDSIDPQTSFKIIEGVDISGFSRIVISITFDEAFNRFGEEAYGSELLVEGSRSDTLVSSGFLTDRQLLKMGSGINRPYKDDPIRGAYQTDVLLLNGKFLHAEIRNNHSANAIYRLRSVTVKGVD